MEKRVERDLNKLKTGFDAEVTLEISAFLDKLKNTQTRPPYQMQKNPRVTMINATAHYSPIMQQQIKLSQKHGLALGLASIALNFEF